MSKEGTLLSILTLPVLADPHSIKRGKLGRVKLSQNGQKENKIGSFHPRDIWRASNGIRRYLAQSIQEAWHTAQYLKPTKS